MFLPRSPLAIIIPSLALIRLLMFLTPALFSILDIIFCFGNIVFSNLISSDFSANESAR